MKIRKWKNNPFTYAVMRVKSPHLAHHLFHNCRTKSLTHNPTHSAITQLIAAQHEQMSSSSNLALQYPTTPPSSFISDDDNDEVSTPIFGNPAQLLPYTPNRHPNPLQLCQSLTPIPDKPESTTPKNHRQSDIFSTYNIPNPSTSTSFNNPLNILAVANRLQNLALHPNPACNEWVTGVWYPEYHTTKP